MASKQSQTLVKQVHAIQPVKPSHSASAHRSSGHPKMGNQMAQRLLRERVIQAKLTVNQPGDHFEQEADRVAEQVMRMPDRMVKTPPRIQRMCSKCDEEVHRQAGQGPEQVGDGFKHPSSGGRPLPDSERRFFEPRLGRDLSPVRVHTGRHADKAAHSVNALAYTLRNDIVFAEGQYRAGSDSGRRLLAHELTHTIQQGGASEPIVQRTIGDGHDLTSSRFTGDLVLEAVYDDERLLKSGDPDAATIRKLQQTLVDAGFPLPHFGVDGDFGQETKAAVEAFQRASGLTGRNIDGIVGPTTMGWLDQRFSAGATPAGTTPGATTGCTTVKTVTIDLVSLSGSNRDPIADLEFANTVFNQCCVRFTLSTGVSATDTQTSSWLGGNTDLQRIHSCSRVSREEKDLRENATAEFGLSSRYKVFYVGSMSPPLNGVNFSPDCSSGDRAPFNRHLYVSNSANRRTLAHELAHIPIRGLRDHTRHSGGSNNLMIPNGPGSQVTAAQCREVVSNI